MDRRRVTLGALALLVVAIAARPSATRLDIDVDFARSAGREVARAEAAVTVGGASLLVRWTQAALR